MPCLSASPPPLPPLPPGISLVIFTPPTLPNVGLCCKLPIPNYPLPIPVVLSATLPGGLISTYNAFAKAIRQWFDSLQVSCPLQ